MVTALEARDRYLADYDRWSAELPAAKQEWIQRLRAEAVERFGKIGFPSARNEDWKYTSIAPLLSVSFARAAAADAGLDRSRLDQALAGLPSLSGSELLVFVNGRFNSSLSRLSEEGGLRLDSLANAFDDCPELLAEQLGGYLEPGHAFAELNSAFVEDGYVVRVGEGVGADQPVHVLFFSTAAAEPQLCHPRNLIVVADGGSATVVEHFAGDSGAGYFTNAVTEISLGRDSRLRHLRYQDESREAFHIGRVQVHQQAASAFSSHVISRGARLSRTEVSVRLAGESAECDLLGLYTLGGRQHADHHTTVDHAVAHTSSRELYKGIVDERARGVFSGRVIVRENAQQIVAEQNNRNLLLSGKAVVQTRPQLEIYADDVRCSHGAAVGRLDPEAMFYLRQRGIGLNEARAMLTRGFGREALAPIRPEALAADLEACCLAGLGAAEYQRGDLA